MKVMISKTIIDNNGSKFKIGDDIHFVLNRNDKTYSCFGVIKDINDDSFLIENIEMDKMIISGTLEIRYAEVESGVLSITDCGWA